MKKLKNPLFSFMNNLEETIKQFAEQFPNTSVTIYGCDLLVNTGKITSNRRARYKVATEIADFFCDEDVWLDKNWYIGDGRSQSYRSPAERKSS